VLRQPLPFPLRPRDKALRGLLRGALVDQAVSRSQRFLPRRRLVGAQGGAVEEGVVRADPRIAGNGGWQPVRNPPDRLIARIEKSPRINQMGFSQSL
jgi:hypothetical protein